MVPQWDTANNPYVPKALSNVRSPEFQETGLVSIARV